MIPNDAAALAAATSEIETLLAPRSIAIVGASADRSKFGGRMIEVLLLHGFPGDIYPVNPKRDEIFGRRAYPSLAAIPGDVDLVVLVVPQTMVLDAIEECGKKHVRLCIIISTQFAESGEAGATLEQEVLAAARRHDIRLLGVNCLGFFARAARIVLTPSPALYIHIPLPPGAIAMVSQSGAMMATIFDRAAGMGLGFSYGITLGNQTDLGAADFVRFLAQDADTKVICCYLEGLKDGPGLLAAITDATAAGKLVVLLKAGRTAAGARAAFSHTASVASDYQVLEAYVTRAGAIAVDDPGVMLAVASLFERYGRRAVDGVVIVTNSGGAAAVITDRLHDEGISLTDLSPATRTALAQHYWSSHAHNPIDWGGSSDANEDRLLRWTFDALAAEPGSPLILAVLLTNPDMGGIAGSLGRNLARLDHPGMILLLPDKAAEVSRSVLCEAGASFVREIDHAVKAVALYKAWDARRRHCWPMPQHPDRPPASEPPCGMGASADSVLDAIACRALLARYGIPYAKSGFARDSAEAAGLAAEIGYPVVLKAVAQGISHKSEAGGVRVDIADEAALTAAWREVVASVRRYAPGTDIAGMMVEELVRGHLECFVGIKRDPSVGSAVVFGAGGVLIELLGDRAVLPVPVSVAEVSDQLDSLAIGRVLRGYRGGIALDAEALAELIARVGWLAHDQGGRLLELDLNPIIVKAAGEGVVAVDVRARIAVGRQA